MTNILDRKHIDFLKEVSIFSKLSDDEIKSIAPLLFIKEIEEGQNVFARFENEQVLYIVRYGKLVLETSEKTLMLGRAWNKPMGFEPDPDAVQELSAQLGLSA